MKPTLRKLIASLAVVGVVATIAVYYSTTTQQNSSSAVENFRLLAASEKGNDNALLSFTSFIEKHNKNYLTKEEYNARFQIFKNNFNLVQKQNAENAGFQLELNKFSDLSDAEYESMLGLNQNAVAEDPQDSETAAETNDTLLGYPTSVDWRTQGVLGTIKNQASCGGCYAFSTVCSIEAAMAIQKNVIANYAEQQIIDCSSGFGNAGCSGGLMTNSFNYLRTNKLELETDYPYVGSKGTCKYNAALGKFNVPGYVNIAKNSVSAHLNAVAVQPISIAVAASSYAFKMYKSGILNSSTCGTALNHAINLVGYGTENGVDYWIIRNSWGTSWGESGYARIIRSSTDGAGMCGILQLSSYPTL